MASRGFTLLEILVALAILAVALMAAGRAIGVSIQSADHIRMNLLADWVAQNRIVQHRIDRSWPGIGTSTGTATQGGVEFRWEEEVSGTPHPQFRRVEIRVADPADATRTLRRVVSYVARQR